MPLLVDTTIPSTAAALQAADVVITILDARDPLSYRSTYIEGILGNTPLLYVLNKIGKPIGIRLQPLPKSCRFGTA